MMTLENLAVALATLDVVSCLESLDDANFLERVAESHTALWMSVATTGLDRVDMVALPQEEALGQEPP